MTVSAPMTQDLHLKRTSYTVQQCTRTGHQYHCTTSLSPFSGGYTMPPYYRGAALRHIRLHISGPQVYDHT